MSRWLSINPKEIKQKVKNAPGVYVIYLDNSLKYIGQHLNLRNRLLRHISETINKNGGIGKNWKIKFSYSRYRGEWLLREFALTLRLNPSWNKLAYGSYESYKSLYTNENKILMLDPKQQKSKVSIDILKLVLELRSKGMSNFNIAIRVNRLSKDKRWGTTKRWKESTVEELLKNYNL